MAGPLSFHLAWTDPQRRFLRVASQSGRFGWGGPKDLSRSPYADLLRDDRSAVMKRLSFDWAVDDSFQVGVNDTLIRQALSADGYKDKVRFYRQDMPPLLPSAWDVWRSRLEATLTYLLGDLGNK